MKKEIKRLVLMTTLLALITTLLTSCSNIGLMSNNNKYLPTDIDGFGDFMQVFFVLQISMLIVALVLGFFIGGAGGYVSGALHFIWIVSNRDYGFMTVLALFFFLQLVLMLIIPAILALFGKK